MSFQCSDHAFDDQLLSLPRQFHFCRPQAQVVTFCESPFVVGLRFTHLIYLRTVASWMHDLSVADCCTVSWLTVAWLYIIR